MALVQATLSSGLANMTPTGSEATAISNFVTVWDNYWSNASVLGVTATPGSYAAGLSAMQGALSGLSASGAAAGKIQSGIQAFWTAIAASASAIFIVAPTVLVPPITPPPGIAGIAAALAAAFGAATAGSLSLADAADAVATALHTAGGLGAVVSGSVVPAPPAPIPIL
jgi:hypothetical protein